MQTSLIITPPYSVYLSDYTTPGSTRLNLTAYLADLSRPDLDVRFRLLIEGVGIEIKTRENYIGARFNLASGIPRQFFGDELAEYFELQNLDISGVSRSQLERTGALPEGIYRFTLEVLEYNRGVVISNAANSTAWLILNDPPVFNLPLDNEVVIAADPQTVRFQWTPRHKGSPNASFSTEYALKIVEIWPESRNPNDAINTTNAVFETTTTNNYFVYGLAEPPLIPGRKYAFQVQAKAIVGIDALDLFKNNGYSVVRSFTFGESCKPPTKLVAESSGNSFINLVWEPSSSNTAFSIKFKEDTNEANWFDKFSYLPNIRMDKLKPGTNYQVVLQSMCGTLVSEESEPVLISTANKQNDFTCGAIDLNFDLENKTPIENLKVDDYIYAGDFEIKLDSISRSGDTFSGAGMAAFPFLNFVKAKVRFDGVHINTDYRMTDGVITTIYDPFSSMMYDLNNDEDESFVDSDNQVAEDSTESAATNTAGVDAHDGTLTEIDSIYKNIDGEIIIIINNEETVIQPPAEGEELHFIDSNGNQITVNSAGDIQKTDSNSASTPTNNQSAEEGLKFTFGPLVVTLNEEKEPTQSAGNCIYNEIEASVEIMLEDLGKGITHTFNIESAIFSYIKICETGDFVSAKIAWKSEDGTNVGTIGELEASVFNVLLEIDADYKIEGLVEFFAKLNQDKPLTDLAILRAGISGDFKYTFAKSTSGFKGDFDFKGVTNINLDLVKQNQVVASLQNGSLDESGVLAGKIRLIQEIDYQSAQFSVKIKKLAFDILYGVGQEFLIKSGNAILIISKIKLVEGELKVLVDIEDNNISAGIESNELHAFGMNLTNLNIKLNLDANFNFTTLSGSLIATHPDFAAELEVHDLIIENGGISVFNLSGDVNYKDLKVVVQQANFDNATNAILLSAYAEIENNDIKIAAEIEDFAIDQHGTISWGGYNVSFDGIKTFGPLTVAISAETGAKNGKWRSTTAKASLTINLEDAVSEPITITNATISYLKHKNKEQFKNIRIELADVELAAPNIGPLQAHLQALNIQIETDYDYLTGNEDATVKTYLSDDSYVKFKIGIGEDINLGNLLVLQSGVSGIVTYNFSGEGLKGVLDYQQVENLNILVKSGESTLASLTNASIPEDGVLTGTVSALPGASFTTGGLTAEIQELTFNVIIPFQKDISATRITSGYGRFNINNIGDLDGSLALELVLDEVSNISAQVLNTSEISAFGMNLSEFDLQVELRPDLQIKSIKGQLAATHPQFDAALLVSEFTIEEGKLQVFNFEGKVAYKGFNLDLKKVDYRENTLAVDGLVAINVSGSAAWLAVEELIIADDGTITIRGIEGELDKSPVYIAFSASMDEARFTGSFTGDLKGIGLEGKIAIGVENKLYNYAYLELTAKGNIPLAGTGLKLTRLGGQFGYNYTLKYESPGQPPTGSPQEGNYVVGLTLGVADMADMVEVTGNSVIQFGNGKFDLNLNGTISIPKENSIATGNMNVHYVLPDNTLSGSLAVDVNVPPQTGKLLRGNFAMAYAMGNNEWSVSTTDISAKLFSEIDFSGNITLAGSGDGDKFSGVLSGYSSYDFIYKNEFEWAEAKLIVEINAGFNFNGNIAFDDTGAEGDVSLYLYANGELGIESIIGGYNKLIGLNGSSLARLSFNRDSALLVGQMNVVVYFFGFEHEVDVDIDKRI